MNDIWNGRIISYLNLKPKPMEITMEPTMPIPNELIIGLWYDVIDNVNYHVIQVTRQTFVINRKLVTGLKKKKFEGKKGERLIDIWVPVTN